MIVMVRIAQARRELNRDADRELKTITLGLEEAKRFKEIQVESLQQAGKSYVGDFLPFVSWIGVGKGLEKSMIELHGKRDEFIHNLIDQHRRKMKRSHSEEKSKTLIEVLLSLQQTKSEFFKDDIIRGLVLASPIMFGKHRLSIKVRQEMENKSEDPAMPTAQSIANAFIQQYYVILHKCPDMVYKFYCEPSVHIRFRSDGAMTMVTSLQFLS